MADDAGEYHWTKMKTGQYEIFYVFRCLCSLKPAVLFSPAVGLPVILPWMKKGSQVKQGWGILFREDGVPHLTSPAALQTKISSASNLLQWKVMQENKLQMLNVLFFSRLNDPQQDPSVGHS